MKTEIVFKLEKNPEGFTQELSPDCQVAIKNTSGFMYLNYENREGRVMGHFTNLRREGEFVKAEVELFENYKVLEDRIEFSIEGAVLKKNENNEATVIGINSVAALMHNKF